MNRQRLQQWLTLISRMGADAADSDDLRLHKTMLIRASSMFIAAGALWGALYILLGEPLAGAIPLSYAVISTLSIVLFAVTRRYRLFLVSQLWLILLLPFLLQIALGGFINSSAVAIWSLVSPLGALIFDEPRHVLRWLAAYLALVVLSGLLQPYVRLVNNLSPALIIFFFVMNIGTVSTIAVVLLYYFVRQKNTLFALLKVEQQQSESLLLNVLPEEIAAILKNGNRTIADYFDSVSYRNGGSVE